MNLEIKELIKKEYHHLDSLFFNTAYFGPSPYSAKQKVSRALQKELDPSFFDYNTWMGISDRLREKIAQLVGCDMDDITHSTSSSDVVNTVWRGYPFKDGDVVAAINKDYPSNVLPWMLAEKRTDVKLDLLELDEEVVPTAEWLAKKLDPKTKIFNISHVTFDTGKKSNILEIGKLCRERGILFIVDATQSLGGMPITKEELEYIDVLACSSYKWILGPYGHAFAYVSKEAQKIIDHSSANWILSPNSKVVYSLLDYTTETLPGARKYDRGQAANPLTNACLEAGLEFLNTVGLENIQKHNIEIRDYFLENCPKNKFELITPRDFMGNIVCMKANGIDSLQLERELKHNNVDISVRQGNLRLAFHIFNNKDQVDTLIRALDI